MQKLELTVNQTMGVITGNFEDIKNLLKQRWQCMRQSSLRKRTSRKPKEIWQTSES